jgi:hypothetical protein
MLSINSNPRMAKGGNHLFFTVLCAITLTLSAAR